MQVFEADFANTKIFQLVWAEIFIIFIRKGGFIIDQVRLGQVKAATVLLYGEFAYEG